MRTESPRVPAPISPCPILDPLPIPGTAAAATAAWEWDQAPRQCHVMTPLDDDDAVQYDPDKVADAKHHKGKRGAGPGRPRGSGMFDFIAEEAKAKSNRSK